ncbi:hypothetical protein [Chroogloeocystis siderophila]|jgi:hypothetical protein|uniref:Uncharacterized protein n=1 Tax=Chroogloeocystis siderophila 5.2 s.c.1 TaxID=247279 RepID=A0A1U7HU83_9CHRO|nr:hypothetical protein [Chroogloeocystis siderophila]OKH27142.1 hypothetical protein NIES1031_10580 [Chroogloeocystis siderophila 5.2 s.c.1]
MTNSNNRLDQIEALLAETAQLTRSNALAIQALTDDLVTFKLTVEQNIENARTEREELRQATIGIANLLASLDEDRPTLRKLNTIENKLDRLLQRENGDRA